MAETTTTPAAPAAKSRKKTRRSVPSGQLHVQATFNNTIVTFADKKGNVLAASSAGACGFRGSKKGTAYAAQIAAEKAAEIAKSQYGLSKALGWGVMPQFVACKTLIFVSIVSKTLPASLMAAYDLKDRGERKMIRSTHHQQLEDNNWKIACASSVSPIANSHILTAYAVEGSN